MSDEILTERHGRVLVITINRPESHWGGAFKYAASLLGLPIGDYRTRGPRKLSCPTRDVHRSERLISASD